MDNRETLKKELMVVLLVLCPLGFIASMEITALDILLPKLSQIYNISIDSVQWIQSGFMLAATAFFIIGGRLGDYFNRKFIYIMGLIIITTGALICYLSKSFNVLLIGRVLQGVGSALMEANALAFIVYSFSKKNRGKAIGFLTSIVPLGLLVGPSFGGICDKFIGWKSVFLANVGLGLIVFILALFLLKKPHHEERIKVRFDYFSSILLILATITCMVFFSYLSKGKEVITLGPFLPILFLVLIALVILIDRKHKFPIIDIKMVSQPVFVLVNIIAFFSFMASSIIAFLVPFYCQYVLYLSVLETGLLSTLFPLSFLTFLIIGGILSDKIIEYKIIIISKLIMLIWAFLLLFLKIDSSVTFVATLTFMAGIGRGLFTVPYNKLSIEIVPTSQVGMAGGIVAVIRTMGMAAGINIAAGLYALLINNFNAANVYIKPEIFMDIFYIVIYIVVGIIIFTLGLTLLFKLKKVKNNYNILKEQNIDKIKLHHS